MIAVLAALVGVLFAGGTYLLLQRTLTRILLGLALWGHAVNVLLLLAGGRPGDPPLIGGEAGPAGYADPLPQAMALTAIVITFAILAFLLALAYRSWTLTGDDVAEDDIEDRRIAEEGPRADPDAEAAEAEAAEAEAAAAAVAMAEGDRP